MDDTKKARPAQVQARALFEDGYGIWVTIDLLPDEPAIRIMANSADGRLTDDGPALVLSKQGARFVTDAIKFLGDQWLAFDLAGHEYCDPEQGTCQDCLHWEAPDSGDVSPIGSCAHLDNPFRLDKGPSNTCQKWESAPDDSLSEEGQGTCEGCDHWKSTCWGPGTSTADPVHDGCDDWQAKDDDQGTCEECSHWKRSDSEFVGGGICGIVGTVTDHCSSCERWVSAGDPKKGGQNTCNTCNWWKQHDVPMESLGDCTELDKMATPTDEDHTCPKWKTKDPDTKGGLVATLPDHTCPKWGKKEGKADHDSE
jgi:hypothetical protein